MIATRIQQFHDLHHSEEMLFLGNAWDLLSALALEKAGFKAIGTTSWGIAQAQGYTDGENMDFNTLLRIVETITTHVNIPVTADIESGYGNTVDAVVANVLKLAAVGAAGINIEDSLKTETGLRDIREHSHLLSRIRAALDSEGYQGFYINARIDTYFQKENPYEETVSRAHAYIQNGASGIFVPGILQEEEIRTLAAQVKAPLNVLSLPGLTNVERLQSLGVKRFSFGNAFSDRTAAFLEQTAAQLFNAKDTGLLYGR